MVKIKKVKLGERLRRGERGKIFLCAKMLLIDDQQKKYIKGYQANYW